MSTSRSLLIRDPFEIRKVDRVEQAIPDNHPKLRGLDVWSKVDQIRQNRSSIVPAVE